MKSIYLASALGVSACAIGLIKTNYKDNIQLGVNESSFVMDEKIAPWMDLGHSQSLAGLTWIQGTLYFGGAAIEGVKAYRLGDILKTVISLNPDFLNAYQWAGLFKQIPIEIASEILEKGIKRFPKDWRLHLMYSHRLINELKQFQKASKIMESQKENLDAPVFARNIWKTYGNYSRDTNSEILLLIEKLQQNNGLFAKDFEDQIYQIAIEYLSEQEIQKAFDLINENSITSVPKAIKLLMKQD